MRIQYKILLGLFLFNAFLAFFSPVFNAATNNPLDGQAVGYTDSDLAQFDPNEGIVSMMTAIFVGNTDSWSSFIGVAAFIGINVITFAWALINKNYVFIGVSLFVSLFISLYIKTFAVISLIGKEADMPNTTGDLLITSIIGIIGVAIGLILVFSVVDMFAPASARE